MIPERGANELYQTQTIPENPIQTKEKPTEKQSNEISNENTRNVTYDSARG